MVCRYTEPLPDLSVGVSIHQHPDGLESFGCHPGGPSLHPLQPLQYGAAAEEDLRGIKHEYQRKGVLFVAAAIGSDKENIERIYGNSFLDITDLTKLPVKLAGIIKRFIRL